MDLSDTATDIMSQPGVISSASDEGSDLIKLNYIQAKILNLNWMKMMKFGNR